MTSQQPLEESDELLAAVQSLLSEVRDLRKQLSRYAPREEVTRESRKRAWRFLSAALVCILISQGLTLMTISYCFLDASNSTKSVCKVIPGYGEALEQNAVRLERFGSMLDVVEDSHDRIDSIEERLARLERESK